MDFKDQIKILGEKVSKLKEQILTEEATKNAFIMPFIQTLGYDVFNPTEVVPEFISDIGIKKGEKIDYAVFKDESPILLIECKHWNQNLNLHDGQLLRYFHVSKAKFGLLTNGLVYRFYSDIVEANKMDEKPFLEFDITEINDNQIEELKKFHKSYFDIENIVNTASELKFLNELKQILAKELNSASPDFVKIFAKQVYPGMITAKVLEQFTALLKKAAQQYVSDLITDRLKTALIQEKTSTKEVDKTPDLNTDNESITKNAKIETTQEEIEGFLIVKTILRQRVDCSRIAHRDAQSYFAILLDDNNRKTICRLYLSGSKKYFATLDDSKKEIKKEISSIDDVFGFADELFEIVDRYDNGK